MYRSSKIRRQHIIWQLIIFPRTDAGDSRQRQGLLSSPQQIPRSPAPARFMPIITVPAERPPVALRRMCVDDVPMLLALESDPEVMRYSTGVKPATEARRRELLDWLREAPGKLGHWAVVADGDAVGWASLTPLPGTDRIQLAYRLQRRAWGRGCATASCATMPGACWMSRPCPPSPGRTTWPRGACSKNSASSRPAQKRTTGATPWPICCRVRPRPDPRHHSYPFPGTIHS